MEQQQKQQQQQQKVSNPSHSSSSSSTTTENKKRAGQRLPPSCLRSSNRPKQLKAAYPTKAKEGRNVHFKEIATVLWIECIDDMSDEELDASYYTPKEYFAIRERERILFRQLSNLGTIRSLSDDVLGLESRIQRCHRKGRSRDSIYAVILEQEMNRNLHTGVCSDSALSLVYRPYAIDASRMAQDRAVENSLQVELASDSPNHIQSYRNGSFCGSINDVVITDDKLQGTYQDLKHAMEVKEEKDIYSDVMKYAIACIPPSPVSLRFGHGMLLDMDLPEDEEPWSSKKLLLDNPKRDGDAYYHEEQDDEEMKVELPPLQEMNRPAFPPYATLCGIEYYSHPLNQRHVQQEVHYAQWLAQQESLQASAFHVPRPRRNEATPVPPPERSWDPSLCDFVPMLTNQMVTWDVIE
ncbi:hypothetical protein IV203_022667 [Nitzschia inconspicua]|nr:hypothetical protein IV203_022667 [Nitzschia inconspicua]